MQSRFHMPEIGRFLQPDTIVPDPADPQSLNRYSYVLNNPLRYTDPTGRCPLAAGPFTGACDTVENVLLGGASQVEGWFGTGGDALAWAWVQGGAIFDQFLTQSQEAAQWVLSSSIQAGNWVLDSSPVEMATEGAKDAAATALDTARTPAGTAALCTLGMAVAGPAGCAAAAAAPNADTIAEPVAEAAQYCYPRAFECYERAMMVGYGTVILTASVATGTVMCLGGAGATAGTGGVGIAAGVISCAGGAAVIIGGTTASYYTYRSAFSDWHGEH